MLRLAGRLGRVLSLVVFAALGSAVLMRYSPGYFTEAREMDAAHAAGARTELSALHTSQDSLPALLGAQLRGWSHGDLGRSRHYDIPVSTLIKARANTSFGLLLRGTGAGWLLALAFAIPLSARRSGKGELALTASTAALLAVPVGVLATVCLLLGKGGPAFVLASLIAVRDFKLLYRLLRSAWAAPHMNYARAQGFSMMHMVRVHLSSVLQRELLALAMTSLVVALSSLVPVEVIFDVPGLGQLAWTAATNRDLPVLLAITAILAGCVGFASLFAASDQSMEAAQCA